LQWKRRGKKNETKQKTQTLSLFVRITISPPKQRNKIVVYFLPGIIYRPCFAHMYSYMHLYNKENY